VTFDKDKGFFVNGVYVKLKRVCCTRPSGVGSALPMAAILPHRTPQGDGITPTDHHNPRPGLLEACTSQCS
jgi:hypothetical protein